MYQEDVIQQEILREYLKLGAAEQKQFVKSLLIEAHADFLQASVLDFLTSDKCPTCVVLGGKVVDRDFYQRLALAEAALLKARNTLSANCPDADECNRSPEALLWLIKELSKQLRIAHEELMEAMTTLGWRTT